MAKIEILFKRLSPREVLEEFQGSPIVTDELEPIIYTFICVVMRDRAMPIGIVSFNFYDNKTGLYIRDLVIDPDHRKQGCGSQVVEDMIDTILEKKMTTVVKCRVEAGDNSMVFWAKQGFVPTGEITKDDNPIMEREIVHGNNT